MPKVIASLAEAEARGIFIYFQKAIAAARAVGTARVAMVCQLPWGPLNTETAFETPATFRKTFCPAGFDRTGAAYNIAVKFPWPDLRIVRVLGASPVKATKNITKTGPVDVITVTAKWFGAAGNGITAAVSDASNGVANSFDLVITKTSATTGKSTSEVYRNVDSTQTDAAYWTAVTAKSVLVGGLVKLTTGRPVNGTVTLASGSDGSTITAADYLGTPGDGDAGLAVLEKDPEISFIFTDTVATGIRATVLAGLLAHRTLMADRRFMLLTGDPGDVEADAITDAASYQDDHVVWTFPYGKVLDEDAADDSTPLITIPLTAAFACIASILQPHLSPAFKRRDFTKALKAIKELDAGTNNAKSLANLEAAGVIGFERNGDGVFSPYGSTCTDGVSSVIAGRMADYVQFSIANALDEWRNGPNDDVTQDSERDVAGAFLTQLVRNRKRDHIFKPCLDSAALLDTADTNTQDEMDAGRYTLGLEAKIISEQKQIILSGAVSPFVKITGTTLT